MSLNTEIKFDINLLGFEFYAKSNGNLTIKAYNFTECENYLCSKYFKDSMIIPNSTAVNQWIFFALKGFNRFVLIEAEFISKGTIFMIESNFFMEIDDRCDAMYSDFFVNSSMIFRINHFKNCRIFFKVLTEQNYFISETFFQHKFDQLGKNEFMVANLNSTNSIQTFIYNVTSSNFKFYLIYLSINS